MRDFRPVLFVCGLILLALAIANAIPMAVDLLSQRTEWRAFAFAGLVGGFPGAALMLSARGRTWPRLRGRDAFLATVASWLGCAMLGAVPFAVGSLHLSLTDAFFESMSGLTTTGATVLRGLDHVPQAILLWRALLNWFGGIGIIVTALSVLPVLRIGGMQLFAFEASEEETPRFRMARLTGGIGAIYVLLTIAIAIAYRLAGLPRFDAICQAFSTISTGGFSTSDQSLGHWSQAARWVAIVGMMAGGLSFSRLPALLMGRDRAIFGDSQIRLYLGLIVAAAAGLAAWQWLARDVPLSSAVPNALFDTASAASTSGFYRNHDVGWGSPAALVTLLLALAGGCAGSAAGGIKLFRVQILFSLLRTQLRRLLHPHGVFVIDHDGRPVSGSVIRAAIALVMLYLFAVGLLALALSATGVDGLSALTGSVAAFGNIGPGLGPTIGPGGSYHTLPDTAKWLLTAGMLLGRLEIATVAALLMPAFWKR